jgi:hypothetical protein
MKKKHRKKKQFDNNLDGGLDDFIEEMQRDEEIERGKINVQCKKN